MQMPFVVCQSNGGEYEDRSFVAGIRFGEFLHGAALMTTPGDTMSLWATPPMVPQIDLLAMHHGLLMTSSEITEGWVMVTLTRPEEETDVCGEG